MGLPGPFSRTCSLNDSAPAGNPNPSRWELLEFFTATHAHIIKVRYMDCTNCGGEKILVFTGEFQQKKYLDPHFSDEDQTLVARFHPSKWDIAVVFTKSLSLMLSSPAEVLGQWGASFTIPIKRKR
ncbi:MAG: hypothetical protein GY861_28100 [bacterium]|nr:hypothetical protein [bacterium]